MRAATAADTAHEQEPALPARGVLGAALAARVAWLSVSPEPRRAAQGQAERAVAGVFRRAGYDVDCADDGTLFAARCDRPAASRLEIATLTFAFGHDGDAAVRARLRAAIEALALPCGVWVHVRRWQAERVGVDAVARAIGRAVDAGDSRGQLEAPHLGMSWARVTTPSPAVRIDGPFHGHRMREAMEARVVEACLRPRSAHPLVLACVADRPWAPGRGWLRDLLYGCPVETRAAVGHPARESWFASPSATVFCDPSLRGPAGLLRLGRVGETWRAEAWANPWVPVPFGARALGVAGVDVVDDDPDDAWVGNGVIPAAPRDRCVLGWYEGPSSLEV
jgi:hypothetical protein